MQKLLKLYRLPDNAARIQDAEFQAFVKKCKSLVVIWKRKHELCATDPRWTSATLTDILQDSLEEQAFAYIGEFERYDRDTNEFAKRREVDPGTDLEERAKLAEQLNKAMGM